MNFTSFTEKFIFEEETFFNSLIWLSEMTIEFSWVGAEASLFGMGGVAEVAVGGVSES